MNIIKYHTLYISPATVYVNEISNKKLRGGLGSGLILCLTFGIIYILTIGALLPSYSGSWKMFSVACIIPQIAGKHFQISSKMGHTSTHFLGQWKQKIPK